jgi:hypothetical protein
MITKQPRIPVSSVICPDCKAPVGEKCIKQNGEKSKSMHTSRMRIAARKMLEQIVEETDKENEA